jgi:hypothetical protein
VVPEPSDLSRIIWRSRPPRRSIARVAGVEGDRPEREPSGGRVAAAQPQRLIGELEGDRADQGAGAEAEDQADRPFADRGERAEQRTEQQ